MSEPGYLQKWFHDCDSTSCGHWAVLGRLLAEGGPLLFLGHSMWRTGTVDYSLRTPEEMLLLGYRLIHRLVSNWNDESWATLARENDAGFGLLLSSQWFVANLWLWRVMTKAAQPHWRLLISTGPGGMLQQGGRSLVIWATHLSERFVAVQPSLAGHVKGSPSRHRGFPSWYVAKINSPWPWPWPWGCMSTMGRIKSCEFYWCLDSKYHHRDCVSSTQSSLTDDCSSNLPIHLSFWARQIVQFLLELVNRPAAVPQNVLGRHCVPLGRGEPSHPRGVQKSRKYTSFCFSLAWYAAVVLLMCQCTHWFQSLCTHRSHGHGHACIWTHMHLCVSVYICIKMCECPVGICVCIYVHIPGNVYFRKHTAVQKCKYTRICIHTVRHTYIRTYAQQYRPWCTHHTCIHMYIHTHIHTYRELWHMRACRLAYIHVDHNIMQMLSIWHAKPKIQRYAPCQACSSIHTQALHAFTYGKMTEHSRPICYKCIYKHKHAWCVCKMHAHMHT